MSDLNDRERIERAHNAKRALDEFLDPAFDVVIEAYTARLTDIASSTPWEAGKITALANATRIAQEVRSQVMALVLDGQDAKRGLIRAEKIEAMTPAKRRLLNIGAF